MVPKKADKTQNPAQENVRRTRRKTYKSIQNVTLIKTGPATVPIVTENQNEKAVPNSPKENIKVMLANEVVRRQFPKKENFLECPVFSDQDNPKNVKKKPRKRILKKTAVESSDSPAPKISRQKLKKPSEAAVVANGTLLEQPKKQAQKTKLPPKRKRAINKRSARKVSTDNSIDKQKEVQQSVSEMEKPKRVLKNKLPLDPKTVKTGTKTCRAKRIIKDESKISNDLKIDESNYSDTVADKLHKTRTSSAVSELSWTKCISSSSATSITVSLNDNVCIDNKLPVIKLINIDSKQNNEKDVSDTDITSAVVVDAADDANVDFLQNSCDLNYSIDFDNLPQKNLSSSSSDSSSNESYETSVVDKSPNILQKLASKLKLFDIESIRWVGDNGHNSDAKVKEVQDKLFSEKFLKEEACLIVLCKKINRTLSESKADKDEVISKPSSEIQMNVNNDSLNSHNNKNNLNNDSLDSQHNKNNLELEDSLEQTMGVHESKKNMFDEKPSNCSKYLCGDNDEDDALSLYAESITGMESSTRTSNNPTFEEYVPQPMSDSIFKSPNLISYKPSKILAKEQSTDDHRSTICMKQNADSTSIYRENCENGNFEEVYEDRIGNVKEREKESHNWLFSVKPVPATRSLLFKGVCFFNLMKMCVKINCKFVHDIMDIDILRDRLKLLKEHEFKSEYAMLRAWTKLLKIYGRYFIDECIRRQLTRALIEMVLDFIDKSHSNIKAHYIQDLEVIENTLLYLNNVNLETYQDTLRYVVANDKLLCDLFLNVIAKSQNFFRFKTVFIHLTNFVFDNGRTFDSDVATHILERVSILPYDEGLARALIKVLGNTDPSLFYNSMIGDFEQQLLKSNVGLHVELGLLKSLRLPSQPVLANCYSSPVIDMDSLGTSRAYSENNIRYSPDTTNLDNVNKTPIETKFTLTMNNLHSYNNLTPNSSSTNYSEDNTSSNNFKKFKNSRFIYNSNRGARPSQQRPYKRRFEQRFKTGFSKYPRRSGPSFY